MNIRVIAFSMADMSVMVTLDISESPIESQWGSGSIQGNLDRYAMDGQIVLLIHHQRHAVSELTSARWRHQMGSFPALLALCEGNPPVIGGFPSQRPVTRNYDVFFDLRLDKRLRKQSRRRWFETPLRDEGDDHHATTGPLGVDIGVPLTVCHHTSMIWTMFQVMIKPRLRPA